MSEAGAGGWLGAAEDGLLGAAKGAAAGSVVPGVGTLVGGLVGLATSLVPHIFGADSKPALSAAAQVITGASSEPVQLGILTSDPAAAAQFKIQALQIAADREKAFQQAQLDTLRTGLSDIANARQQTQQLAEKGSVIAYGAPIVSIIITSGFFAAFALMVMHPVDLDEGSRSMVNIMVGGLVAGFSSVITYWLGSTAGSARKTELLAQSVPQNVLPDPSAIVPAGDVNK